MNVGGEMDLRESTHGKLGGGSDARLLSSAYLDTELAVGGTLDYVLRTHGAGVLVSFRQDDRRPAIAWVVTLILVHGTDTLLARHGVGDVAGRRAGNRADWAVRVEGRRVSTPMAYPM